MMTAADVELLKKEAREILIEHGNGVWYAAAMGDNRYKELIKDNQRVHYIYDVLRECWVSE